MPLAEKTIDLRKVRCPSIIVKPNDDDARKYTLSLLADLLSRFERVAIEDSLKISLAEFPTELGISEERILHLPRKKLFQSADLIVSLGGDGTLLGAAQGAARLGLPVLGVNLGTLGFLVEITPEWMSEHFNAIFSGRCFIEERQVLNVTLYKQGSPPASYDACNDLTIKHLNSVRIIELDTRIGDKQLCTLRSDGLIIATPTGSTAYALSCNGPLVQPTLEATLIVPICPHTLTFRPLVVDSKKTIQVTFSPHNQGKALVSMDGQINETLETGEHLTVQSPPYKLKLVQPMEHDYFHTLRTKLRWAEKF